MSKAILKFTIISAHGEVMQKRLHQDIIKIGRDLGSHLLLSDPRASRMHATIEVVSPSEVLLKDLGFEPSTEVNGAVIRKIRLRAGDIICIGSTQLRLDAIEAAVPVPEAHPAESYLFEMFKNGPEVPAYEVELPQVPALEVIVSWGTNILHVSHLTPPRSFYVGEGEGKEAADFFLPAEKLTARKVPLVLVNDKKVALVIPTEATGSIEMSGEPKLSLEQARTRAQPCIELPGAVQLMLSHASKAEVRLNGFVFTVGAVAAGKPLKKGAAAGFDWSALTYFSVAFAAFGSLLGSMAYFVPPMGLIDEEERDSARLLLIQQYLDGAAEREQKKEVSVENEVESEAEVSGEGGEAEEGSMGKESSPTKNQHFALKGLKDNAEPQFAHQAAVREAQDYGIIALLSGALLAEPNAPTSIFGRATSLGRDDLNADGDLFSPDLGEALGGGAVVLSGTGDGGGGQGLGVSLGDSGVMGPGTGLTLRPGFSDGLISSRASLRRAHGHRIPKMVLKAASVKGQLPAGVIRRIVRQNFGRFRMCYEHGLSRDPSLEGRVSVRFVIGRDGAVSHAGNGGSELVDNQVVACVISAFYGLSFPEPEAGVVSVNYPILFSAH